MASIHTEHGEPDHEMVKTKRTKLRTWRNTRHAEWPEIVFAAVCFLVLPCKMQKNATISSP